MQTRNARPARRTRERGFTLIELMTVMLIMAVLVGIAIPNYRISIIMAKEAVLHENLTTLRRLLYQYHVDQGKYPESLQALVQEKYLKELPRDPFTGQAEWEEVLDEPDAANPGAASGVSWVKSRASGTSFGPPHTPYNEW